MKTAWNSDSKSMARQEESHVCWSQYLFGVLKEILQKDLAIFSPWKYQ